VLHQKRQLRQRPFGSSVLLRPLPRTAQQQHPNPGQGVVDYAGMLVWCLIAWIIYLMTPRGVRKHYCRGLRRRYSRRGAKKQQQHQQQNNIHGNRLSFSRTSNAFYETDSVITESEFMSKSDSTTLHDETSLTVVTATTSQSDNFFTQSDARRGTLSASDSRKTSQAANERRELLLHELYQARRHYQMRQGNHVNTAGAATSMSSSLAALPSPEHPAISVVPNDSVLTETMHRLETRGIRLLAHGVQCDAKRVWIRVQEDDGYKLTWQTEFPRQTPNSLGQSSLILMRGGLHTIAMVNIVFLDVGKKTSAFMKPENKHVPAAVCFSLLTAAGSLDLQANSQLERDALVSCLCMVLDKTHTNHDWRQLYNQSPEPSTCFSTVSHISTELIADYQDAYNDVAM
jgi:hypothetical protein